MVCCPNKVTAFLQWAKCIRHRATSSAKTPLYINMDETSVSYNYGRGKGLIVSQRSLPPGKRHRKEPVSAQDAKAHISFLAFLSHDSAVQPKLPQIFIGNKHKFTLTLLRKLLPHIPGGFHLWREDSSWNNHQLMRRALSLLVQCLEGYRSSHQIVLVLDVARCHVHHTISSLANRLGVHLLYVPAKLTWLLQPADTHVFGRLKQRLRKLWLNLRVRSQTGVISHDEWLSTVFEAVAKLFCGVSWKSAFESVGLLDEHKISNRILQQVGWQSLVPISSDILTPAQLQCVFPRRSRINHTSIFRWSLPKAKAKAKASPGPLAVVTSLSPEGPISSRTRSGKKSSAASSK